MHAVRKQILDILKQQGGSTVAELARGLDMAPVSVRHHLDLLQGDNLICVERVRRKGSVGRPQQIYALTDDADELFPNNFACLAESLVRQIKAVLPPEQVHAAFQSIARDIAHELDDDKLEELPLSTRLSQVTSFLNERGYLARWEEIAPQADLDSNGVASYRLHKHHCPYAGMATDHHELCAMDQELVNMLIGKPCHRRQSMADGALCCTYEIELDNNLPLKDKRS